MQYITKNPDFVGSVRSTVLDLMYVSILLHIHFVLQSFCQIHYCLCDKTFTIRCSIGIFMYTGYRFICTTCHLSVWKVKVIFQQSLFGASSLDASADVKAKISLKCTEFHSHHLSWGCSLQQSPMVRPSNVLCSQVPMVRS